MWFCWCGPPTSLRNLYTLCTILWRHIHWMLHRPCPGKNNKLYVTTLETREKNHGTLFSVFYVYLTACVCPWCPSVAQTHHTLFINPPFSFLPLNVSWDPSPWLWNKAAGVSADAIDCLVKSASLYENRKWHLLTVCPFVTSLAAPSEVFQKHPSRWNKTFLLSCITFPCCLFSAASFIESLRPEIHSTQVSERKCFWLRKLDFIVLWHMS